MIVNELSKVQPKIYVMKEWGISRGIEEAASRDKEMKMEVGQAPPELSFGLQRHLEEVTRM